MERMTRLNEASKESAEVDVRLVRELAGGESAALDDLIRRNEPWVRGLVLARCRRPDLVDDVVQQVWLSAWRRADTLKDPRRWRSWLYTLTCRAAIDAVRADTRRRNLLNRLFHGRGDEPAVPASRAAELSEDHQRALRAVRALSDPYRSAFVLRHLSDFSYKQIAEAMGVPDNSVGSLLMRARGLLADALAEER